MGFFRKFRSTSLAAKEVQSDTGHVSSSPPPPLPSASQSVQSSPSGSAFFPSRLSTDQLARPSLPSSSSTPLGWKKKPWRRKGSEGDMMAGPTYQDGLSPDARFSAVDLSIGSENAQPLYHRRPGVTNAPSPVTVPHGNTPYDPQYDIPTPRGQLSHTSADRAVKVTSGQFRQQGGILGRLGFEGEEAAARRGDASWIDSSGRRSMDRGQELRSQSVVRSIGPQTPGVQSSASDSNGKMSEELEILESVEKKQKFWQRPRRPSKAMSDTEDDAVPASPTPRKATSPNGGVSDPNRPLPAPPADSSPRPPTLRRPSSSLFSNPFARSVSRTSVNDIEVPVSSADDKSFQLKSFRHISGTSDVEPSNGLQSYLMHIPRDYINGNANSAVTPSGESNGVIGQTAAASSAANAAANARPRAPSRAQISRPPSVAASLASLDDMGSQNKIPAAAFRKGRKASYGAGVSVDATQNGEDDDDDVPLGMISRSRVVSRAQSALSSPNLADGVRSEEVLAGPSSTYPSTQASDAATSVDQNISSPVSSPVVQSAASPSLDRQPQPPKAHATTPLVGRSRPEGSPVPLGPRSMDNLRGSSGRASSAHSPSPAPSALPAQSGAVEEKEMVEFPTSFDSNDNVPLQAQRPIHSTQPSGPWFEVHEEVLDAQTNRVVRDEPKRDYLPDPLLIPAQIPAKELSLSPVSDVDTAQRLAGTSPIERSITSSGRKSSMLEEPVHVLHHATTTDSDERRNTVGSFDADLVITSMAVFAASPEKEKKFAFAFPPAPATALPPAPPTAYVSEQAGSAPPDDSTRVPLSARLAKAASTSPPPRTRAVVSPSSSSVSLGADIRPHSWAPPDMSVSTLSQLIDEEKAREDLEKTPTAAPREVTAAPVKARSPSSPTQNGQISSSFARARPTHSRSTTGSSRGKVAWESSDGESDEEKPAAKAKSQMPTKVRPVLNGPRKSSLRPRSVSALHDSPSSSSEDESLALLRVRASQSSLSVNKIPSAAISHRSSPRVPPTALPPSPAKSALARPQHEREASASRSPPVLASRLSSTHVSQPSSPQKAAKSVTIAKSPVQAVARLSSQTATGTASPASSQSATSESIAQPPSTPREGSIGPHHGGLPDGLQSQWRPEGERGRRHSQMPPSSYFDPPSMPQLQPGMDHKVILSMMKQQWQAHFMAAAYRASEEEWERASVVSGTTSAAPPPFAPMPQIGQMGMPYGMPYGYPVGMGMPGMPPMPMQGMASMPMPGMPAMTPMPGMPGIPWYPPYPATGSVYGGSVINGAGGSNPSGGGMYNYAPASQSVFGGEFGPPQRSTFYSYQQPTQQGYSNESPPVAQHDSERSRPSALIDLTGQYGKSTPGPVGGYKRPTNTHHRTTSGGPPTSWRNYSASYLAEGESSTPRRSRPVTQIIN